MATDYFLKLDGIKGESTDHNHKEWIELQSFSWGLSNAGSFASGGGGAGAGKVNFQDFHFVKRADTTSPQLMLACASGQHIKKATFTVRNADSTSPDYMKISLENVMVSSFLQSGAGVDEPTDQFSLNFAKIEYSHAQQNSDGQPVFVVAGWDLGANKKV